MHAYPLCIDFINIYFCMVLSVSHCKGPRSDAPSGSFAVEDGLRPPKNPYFDGVVSVEPKKELNNLAIKSLAWEYGK